jgi:glycosyltransferase involved in cell wall biosynthesis
MRPQHAFVAYGAGDDGIANRLREEARRLPNFRFGGPLLRGENHTLAFCHAAAFFMPTHASLGESFGLTIIESLSKGVPVIASTSGSVPELLDVPGPSRAGTSLFGTTCEGKDMDCYIGAVDAFVARTPATSAAIQRATRERFDMLRVVDKMLNFTIDALRETEQHRVIATAKSTARSSV